MYAAYKNEPQFSHDPAPDNTPVRSHQIRLSDKQIDSLKSLKSRNYGGLVLGVVNEFNILVSVVNQLTEDDEVLDNYD
jgi:hypothetical protein